MDRAILGRDGSNAVDDYLLELGAEQVVIAAIGGAGGLGIPKQYDA